MFFGLPKEVGGVLRMPHFSPDSMAHPFILNIHTYTHIHTYIHTYMHTYIHTHTYTYIHTYIYICMYIHVLKYTYVYIYILWWNHKFFAELFLGVGGRDPPPFLKYFSFYPPHPPFNVVHVFFSHWFVSTIWGIHRDYFLLVWLL